MRRAALLDSFSTFAAPRKLRRYQLEAGEAIVRSVLAGEGRTFTVCMARQSGKNELAAQLEAYLLHLYARGGGQIVKAAPSFRPQIVNSQLRLREILSQPFSAGRWQEKYGYMLEMGRARIVFFSADPAANVVGATASVLLEVDEAQDVDSDAYWRDFRPMASTARATTVLYGTPWTDDNILEEQRRRNVAEEKRTGLRLNFEAPWASLAAISPPYREFVQGEIDRLGREHPTIRTQYLLQPVAGAGRLFPAHLLDRMRGSHRRQDGPEEGTRYVMGVDVAGQVADPTSRHSTARILNDRDDTVITVAEVVPSSKVPSSKISGRGDGGVLTDRGDLGVAIEPGESAGPDNGTPTPGDTSIRVVRHYRWRGISHADQYERLLRLIRDHWRPARVCVDATGVGAGLASFLLRSLPVVVEPVAFTVATRSELGFGLLAAAETGRLSVHSSEGEADTGEFWRQMAAVRYQLNHTEEMTFYVPAEEGHDDFVMSLALAVRAAGSIGPRPEGSVVRAPRDEEYDGW